MRVALVSLIIFVVFTGCDTIFGLDQRYPRIWIGQTGLVLMVDDTVQLSADVQLDFYDLRHGTVADRWWSSDRSVVTVDSTGRLVARGRGLATVSVEYSGVVDSGTVRVRSTSEPSSLRWKTVAVGDRTACALTTDQRAYCWGSDYWGEIGDGVRRQWTLTYSPAAVAGARTYLTLAVGNRHACALSVTRDVYCWGGASVAGTRDRTEDHILSPTRVAFEGRVASISAGADHVCALDEKGIAYCWGGNAFGQIGDGTAGIQQSRHQPTAVDTDLRFRGIAAGMRQTCAITVDGQPYCWGGWRDATAPQPERVESEEIFRELTGRRHVCGRTEEEKTFCWGPNVSGELGVDSPRVIWSPIEPATALRFVQLTGGRFSTCGVVLGGQGYCWGSNDSSQLGTEEELEECDGSIPYPCTYVPAAVAGGLHFRQISTGVNSSCGVTTEDALYCWGSNDRGQLGNGFPSDGSPIPVRVADPVSGS